MPPTRATHDSATSSLRMPSPHVTLLMPGAKPMPSMKVTWFLRAVSWIQSPYSFSDMPAGSCQAFDLVRVGPAVVLLEDVDEVEPAAHRSVDHQVARAAIGERVDAHVVLLHQGRQFVLAADVDLVGDHLRALQPRPGVLERPVAAIREADGRDRVVSRADRTRPSTPSSRRRRRPAPSFESPWAAHRRGMNASLQ